MTITSMNAISVCHSSLWLTGLLAFGFQSHLLAADSTLADAGWVTKELATWPAPILDGTVVTNGVTDIRWKPMPYVVPEARANNRYIDYATGDDTRDGKSQATAWKHHPWDAQATGQAAVSKGIQSYAFKSGVVYRGQLIAKESGQADEPIRLFRDPTWGKGVAVLSGAESLTGWVKADGDALKQAGFPAEAQKGSLWQATVPGSAIPRGLWQVSSPGTSQRLTLARWPNWQQEHPYDHFTQWFRVEDVAVRFPRTTIFAPKVLKGLSPASLKGATVWVDHPNKSGEFSVMGPFPSSIGSYNPEKGSIQAELNHPVRHPCKNSPFYLENTASFLDQPGEWYFDAQTRLLTVWPKDGKDPSGAGLEAASREVLLQIDGQQFIDVAGITFTNTNVADLNEAPNVGGYKAPMRSSVNCAIRLLGNCQNITIHHVYMSDLAGAGISNMLTSADDVVRNITISDSEFYRIDNDAITLNRGFTWRNTSAQPKGHLTDVKILRNNMQTIGLRCSQSQGGQGIELDGVEICDVAGNLTHTTGGQGINVVGGRPGGGWMGTDGPSSPLVRVQIRSNKVVDSLLYRTDFGGIEFWGNGPAYIYNNISANPIGFVAHRKVYHKNEAFYMDHGIKAYVFNNIGWSERRADAYKGMVGDCFINEIRNQWNEVFHNTGYCFRSGQRHTGTYGDQQHVLANIFEDCYFGAISHWGLAQAQEIAFANNIASGESQAFYSRWRGETFVTPDEFTAFVADLPNNISKSAGWISDESPMRNPEQRDFRLTDTSPAIDRGVKVFVPWGLSATVGEWHFRRHAAQPEVVLGYDLFAQKCYGSQTSYLTSSIPRNHLEAKGYTVADYEAGILEDWVPGALTCDGVRPLRLAQSILTTDFSYKDKKDNLVEVSGSERKTANISTENLLIEVVCLARAADGMIIGKLTTDAGYALSLQKGKPMLVMRSGGAEWSATAPVSIADGKWHHVVAEADRQAGALRLYVDGKQVAAQMSGAALRASVSLANSADLLVADGFHGALDYLRIAQGTLADSETTIAELMSWEFNGPQDHDFASHPMTGAHRDVGALEHETISGLQEIHYTPPAPVADKAADAEAEAGDSKVVFKTGADRTVSTFGWGSISTPKEARIGEVLDIQVAFATETLAKEQQVCADLHGWAGAKSLSAIAHSNSVKGVPGVTTPYELPIKVPAKDGLNRLAITFYVSPDGSYKGRTISEVIQIPLGAAK